MKTFLILQVCLLVSFCLGADLAPTASSAGTRHYIQLIRGSDETTPPETGAILVGLKVRKQLEPVFRWKNYWEVQRTTLAVEDGKTAQVNLRNGQILEIDLRQTDKRTLRLFRNKKLVRSAVCSRGQELSIQGSDPGDGKIWFIVVRTNPPTT